MITPGLVSILVLLAVPAPTPGVTLPGQAPGAGAPAAGAPGAGTPAAADPAPELSFKDLDGTTVTLASLRGRQVLINFWATWCGACRAEMPLLAKLGAEYGQRGITLVAAAADGDPLRVRKYLADSALQLPIVWLSANASDIRKMGLGDDALPATALIDREGRIVWRQIGVVEEKSLRSALEQLATPAP